MVSSIYTLLFVGLFGVVQPMHKDKQSGIMSNLDLCFINILLSTNDTLGYLFLFQKSKIIFNHAIYYGI